MTKIGNGTKARERGATMVSVMLMTVSLLTISVLMIRSSKRELNQANAIVARDRALEAARATTQLGAAHLRRMIDAEQSAQTVINDALVGYNSPGDPSACLSIFEDCVPGGGSATGVRNRALTGKSDCAGRACMRQGAIARLPDASGVSINWVQVPLRGLLAGADSEARVTLWVRNNGIDALAGDGGGSWVEDGDGRVVLTALATVRNTTIAVEQEFVLAPGTGLSPWNMSTPDIGYGGGHNNDNVVAAVCIENFAGYQED